MKLPFSGFFFVVLATIGLGATNPASPAAPLTAKELRQGYREHVILARPRAGHHATIDADETRERIRVRQRFSRFGDLRVIDLDEADSADTAVGRLRATGRYEFVEPDYLRWVQASPNDPKFNDGSLWALNNTGQTGTVIGVVGADIKALSAWDVIHDAPNVVVAVVDTGINLNHQDIAANLWTNPSPTRGDVHGANFVGGRGTIVSGDPTDDDGHGTHVAGTIGAAGNNGVASTGIAWRVQLMALKVFPANASGSVSEIAAGVNYAISHGAHIINASYGGQGSTGYSQTELAAITAARNAGVIFVAAAGNDSANTDITRFYPASHALDNIVTVGASNRRDELATAYTNYGAAVDLFAPGDEIVSLNYANNTGTVSLNGTSMAAPHVAGSLALLKAQFPSDTYRQLINRLLRGVDRGDRFVGKAQTGGRLNLYRALTTATNRPFNDDFADRPHFNTNNLAIRSSNTGGSGENGEPANAGAQPTTTLWWEWTAPASGSVSIDTAGSVYDTVLAVYTGNALGSLALVQANDDDIGTVTSRVRFTAQAGVTYQIVVDGKNGASGLTLLNLGTTPANDTFASPVTLSGVSAQVSATNAHCSRETNEPTILGNAGGTSLWYEWTAPRTGRCQISVVSTDFDPLLAVYTGSSLTSLTTISVSDNTGTDNAQTGALCTVNAVAGTTYRIAIDSKGATVGQFTLSLVDSVWQATTGASVTGAAAVAGDGTVYVGSTDRSVYAFAPDGAQKWSYATGGSIDTCSPAIADDGTVYVGSNDGKCYAFAPDGTRKWTHDFGGGSTAVFAGCSPAVAADGTIYIRVSDGYVHALNPSDGSERWKSRVNATAPNFYGNPVVAADGTIYQGSDETDHTLYAINPDGTSKWSLSIDSGIYGAPAIDGSGNLYFGTLTGGVYSITPAKTQRWRKSSGGNISSSLALSADGTTLYYAGYDAVFYARDTATGEVRWTYPLGAEVRASAPAIDAIGVIYIGCYDSKLYAINPNGTPNRTYDMGNVLRSPPAIAGTRLYVGSNDQKLYAFDLTAGSAGGPWPQYRANARRLGRAVSESLSISVQPQSQTAVNGYPLTLSVTAVGQGSLSYQWKKDGVAISGATSATYTVPTTSAATAGSYTVVIGGTQGSVTSNAAVVAVEAANPGRLINLSVRTTAGTASQTLIVGFSVKGDGTKPLLVRGIGPSLVSYGISDALTLPELRVLQILSATNNVLVASNNRWGGTSTLANTFSSVGAFPLDNSSNDDALVMNATANGGITNYSAQITGANDTTGTAMAELYDLDPLDGMPASRLFNISARAQVGTGDNILIAGFVISGNVPKTLLIRGVGPALTNYGVTGVLNDPQLALYNNTTKIVVKTNDNWGGDDSIQVAAVSVGAFPLSTTSRDSAILVTLPPGGYSAQVSGVNSTTGVALVEVYEVP